MASLTALAAFVILLGVAGLLFFTTFAVALSLAVKDWWATRHTLHPSPG
jgi:hypothetical protein